MSNSDLYILVPAAVLLLAVLGYILLSGQKKQKLDSRIARVTRRRATSIIKTDMLSLRKNKEAGIPVLSKLLQGAAIKASLRARLERAGLKISPDMYITICAGLAVFSSGLIVLFHKPLGLALCAALMLGGAIPYFVVGSMGTRRLKKFLGLFPDAIDFIVRGLRSGLPATESMNMVGVEMEEPIGSIFAGIGESVRLGVPVDKALNDVAKKLNLTEFNFFVTSIVLQRETGGNLSEILSNLSDVLRKRFMMRMKIKAMSSEAKASAMIVGALPFLVILALLFVSPGYLDPMVDDPRGHIASAGAILMMLTGVGIMVKMTKFEI